MPSQLQTFDAWDFVSAKQLQTGWIVASYDRDTSKKSNFPSNFDDKIESSCTDNGNSTNQSFLLKKHRNSLRDECRLAQELAKEKPYCVPMESIDAFIIGSNFEDSLGMQNESFAVSNTDSKSIERRRTRIFQSLNGRIVALCIDTTAMECLGYGILRSIDWEQQMLYILIPSSVAQTPSSLSRVKALVGGSIQLPLALLYRGVYAESFPYLTTALSLNPDLLGSAPMKSRNDIARRGLNDKT